MTSEKPLSSKVIGSLVLHGVQVSNRALNETDVASHVGSFIKKSLEQKAYNEKSAYWTGWNDAIVQLLAIHDEIFGDFK